MSAPAVMPFCIGDYAADTGHLTTLEHGAYFLLIMHYWQHGGLPDDAEQLAKIVRISDAEQWSSIARTLSGLFLPGWRHKRIDAELSKAYDRSQRRRNAGKLGGLARSSNAQAMLGQEFQTPPISKDANLEEVLYLDSVLEQEPSKLASTRDRPQAAKRATRIPANFQPDLDEAERLGLSRRDAETEAAGFADYWRSKPANATKLDWQATWRNWVRKTIKDNNKGGNIHGQRRPQPGAQESPTRIAGRIARGGG